MRKRAAVQGRPFALAHAYTASMHQNPGRLLHFSTVKIEFICKPRRIDMGVPNYVEEGIIPNKFLREPTTAA